jgi:arylformamidase
MTHLIDISAPITPDMPVWPGDPELVCETPMHVDKGDPATVSRWTMSAHCGTHVDAPAHFIAGATKLQELSLDGWQGACQVIHITHPSEVTVDEIASQLSNETEKVLFKTANSSSSWYKLPFNKDFIHIPPATAQWLVEKGIDLVGIDYLSVESFYAEGAPTHHCLLGNNVRILEGLVLTDVAAGTYQLHCSPMHLAHPNAGDGAPARAWLSK